MFLASGAQFTRYGQLGVATEGRYSVTSFADLHKFQYDASSSYRAEARRDV